MNFLLDATDLRAFMSKLTINKGTIVPITYFNSQRLMRHLSRNYIQRFKRASNQSHNPRIRQAWEHPVGWHTVRIAESIVPKISYSEGILHATIDMDKLKAIQVSASSGKSYALAMILEKGRRGGYMVKPTSDNMQQEVSWEDNTGWHRYPETHPGSFPGWHYFVRANGQPYEDDISVIRQSLSKIAHQLMHGLLTGALGER